MSDQSRTTLHFSRFEFKYRLDQARREQVEAELQHFVELDPYVAQQPQHMYFVRSLYFDDQSFSAFHAKEDGVLLRSKFRVRTYARGIDDPAPWFLEVKGRYNNLVFKHRTPVLGAFDRRAAGRALSQVLLQHAGPGQVRDQFEFSLFRRQIQPGVLVDYLRRPYVSRFDPEFRLTFDSSLAATATDTMYPVIGPAPRPMLRGFTVMEVKFRRHVPAWFHRILQAFELRRESISKVCTATQALGLQSEPN